MTYGKRYVIRWTPQLKRVIVLTLVVCFVLGTLLGFIVGFSIRKPNNEPVKDNNISSTSSNTYAIKPTFEVTPIDTSMATPNVLSSAEPKEPEIVYYDVPLSQELQEYIFMLCDENDIPVALILGMIDTESSFRPNIISDTDDYGLMQINTINHEWLSEEYGITDFLDPFQNVFCGITIIAGHYHKYQDVDKALMAYNLGATGASRLWNKGIYSTQYTEKVTARYEFYQNCN